MANEEQIEFWSEGSGRHWIDREAELDAFFAPVDQVLLDRAGALTGLRLLDVGSGTGATVRKFHAAAEVVSYDVSKHFVAVAAGRAADAGLTHYAHRLGDAQVADLGSGYDLAISRFGVMFFDDPVAAFANIRKALRPGGRIVFAAWAPFKENPWFNLPFFAATDLLGRPAPADPRAPGPFAFSDRDYVLDILASSGWDAPQVDVVDLIAPFPGSSDDAAAFMGQIGAAPRVVREMGGTAEDMQTIIATVATKLRAMEQDGVLRMPLKLHLLEAQNPG